MEHKSTPPCPKLRRKLLWASPKFLFWLTGWELLFLSVFLILSKLCIPLCFPYGTTCQQPLALTAQASSQMGLTNASLRFPHSRLAPSCPFRSPNSSFRWSSEALYLPDTLEVQSWVDGPARLKLTSHSGFSSSLFAPLYPSSQISASLWFESKCSLPLTSATASTHLSSTRTISFPRFAERTQECSEKARWYEISSLGGFTSTFSFGLFYADSLRFSCKSDSHRSPFSLEWKDDSYGGCILSLSSFGQFRVNASE